MASLTRVAEDALDRLQGTMCMTGVRALAASVFAIHVK